MQALHARAGGSIKNMGKQINFYLHNRDLEWFYEILKKQNVVFIPTQYDERYLTIIENPSVTEVEDMYLVRAEDLNKLTFCELGGVNKAWGIDRHKESPIVEFDRSGYLPQHRIIRRGRLYFRTDYLSESKLIKKDESFLKWANSLINVARRKFIKRKEIRGFLNTFYLAPYANEWVEQNNVKVKSGGYVLEIEV
jgi:hypothetical protein